MGWFVHFAGRFECLRCRRVSDTAFQTKLLRSDAETASRTYHVGDTEVMDGLDDFYPLEPWDGCSPLVAAVSEWDCPHCGLNYQLARGVFDIEYAGGQMVATIREMSGLLPLTAADLNGIHYIEYDIAGFGEYDDTTGLSSWSEFEGRWVAWSVRERCERVAAGYRRWCREIAGVDWNT